MGDQEMSAKPRKQHEPSDREKKAAQTDITNFDREEKVARTNAAEPKPNQDAKLPVSDEEFEGEAESEYEREIDRLDAAVHSER